MTAYVILQRLSARTWERVGSQEAASPKAALRLHHAAQPLTQGEYAAVPERNWTVLKPELVTETRLVFK